MNRNNRQSLPPLSRYRIGGNRVLSPRGEENMRQSRGNRAHWLEALMGLLLLASTGQWACAQEEQWHRQRSEKKCPQPPCPEPGAKPLEITPVEVKPGERPSVPLPTPAEEPTLTP